MMYILVSMTHFDTSLALSSHLFRHILQVVSKTLKIFKLLDVHACVRLWNIAAYVGLYHIGERLLAYDTEKLIVIHIVHISLFACCCLIEGTRLFTFADSTKSRLKNCITFMLSIHFILSDKENTNKIICDAHYRQHSYQPIRQIHIKHIITKCQP